MAKRKGPYLVCINNSVAMAWGGANSLSCNITTGFFCQARKREIVWSGTASPQMQRGMGRAIETLLYSQVSYSLVIVSQPLPWQADAQGRQ